jgi:hypothetical protein
MKEYWSKNHPAEGFIILRALNHTYGTIADH